MQTVPIYEWFSVLKIYIYLEFKNNVKKLTGYDLSWIHVCDFIRIWSSDIFMINLIKLNICVKSVFIALSSKLCHFSDFIDIQWYISKNARDRITLSQCQWLRKKSNRLMWWSMCKQHTRWRLLISLHAWFLQNKSCGILCKTHNPLWWDFIWPFTQRQHISFRMIHLFSIWAFFYYIVWMHVEFCIVIFFSFMFCN